MEAGRGGEPETTVPAALMAVRDGVTVDADGFGSDNRYQPPV